MKIIIFLFVAVIFAFFMLLWGLVANTRIISAQAKNTAERILSVSQKQDALLKYTDQAPFPLEKFYLEVFNDIKNLSSYYHAACEIKPIEAKEFVSMKELFKEAQFQGVRYVDVLCRFDFKDSSDINLLDSLYKMLEVRPIEVLESSLEKGVFSLTMRMYGSLKEGGQAE